jgi:hypothetical protein
MRAKPPMAATWLLGYLGDSPYFESLIGDLDEFCEEGRSRWWYWRQTLVAVADRFAREIWSNKFVAFGILLAAWAFMPIYNLGRLFALRALVTGGAVMPLYDLNRTPALNLFETSFQEIPMFLGRLAKNGGWPPFLAACALLVFMAFIFGLGTGSLVGRLHRRHRNTMVVLYAVSMLISVLPNACGFAAAAYSTRSFGAVSHFLVYSANNTALLAGIVLAGFLNSRSGRRVLMKIPSF